MLDYNEGALLNFFLRLWRDAPAASVQTIRQWFPAAIASFVAIAVTAGISSWIIPQASVAPHMLLVASMGASVMLVIAIPNSPLTQPYALVMGHIMPATIGVLCAMLPLSMALQAATCIGLSLGMMYVLRCLHPPGGAASLVPIIMGADAVGRFDYVFIPV